MSNLLYIHVFHYIFSVGSITNAELTQVSGNWKGKRESQSWQIVYKNGLQKIGVALNITVFLNDCKKLHVYMYLLKLYKKAST